MLVTRSIPLKCSIVPDLQSASTDGLKSGAAQNYEQLQHSADLLNLRLKKNCEETVRGVRDLHPRDSALKRAETIFHTLPPSKPWLRADSEPHLQLPQQTNGDNALGTGYHSAPGASNMIKNLLLPLL